MTKPAFFKHHADTVDLIQKLQEGSSHRDLRMMARFQQPLASWHQKGPQRCCWGQRDRAGPSGISKKQFWLQNISSLQPTAFAPLKHSCDHVPVSLSQSRKGIRVRTETIKSQPTSPGEALCSPRSPVHPSPRGRRGPKTISSKLQECRVLARLRGSCNSSSPWPSALLLMAPGASLIHNPSSKIQTCSQQLCGFPTDIHCRDNGE